MYVIISIFYPPNGASAGPVVAAFGTFDTTRDADRAVARRRAQAKRSNPADADLVSYFVRPIRETPRG
jgi:hypothetical protein